jgi:methylglutaconyl-CoA hydratase
MPAYQHIITDRTGPVLRVWLNRPELRNAFNPQLIDELATCFTGVRGDAGIRAVLLGGRGPFFCAGADLNWMAEMVHYTSEQNYQDALRLAEMLEAIDTCPAAVIGVVQCGAYGGALGLMACCDIVVCDMEARFAFTEVRLGLAPATIAPYVIAKIGVSHARSMMIAGQGFDAPHAQHIGLVHRLVPVESLEQAAQAMAQNVLLAGPAAVVHTKQLLRELAGAPSTEVKESTAKLIAELRAGEEGQEGLDAFIKKRQPRWQADHGLGIPTLKV